MINLLRVSRLINQIYQLINKSSDMAIIVKILLIILV